MGKREKRGGGWNDRVQGRKESLATDVLPFYQQKRHEKVITNFVPTASGNSFIYLSPFIQQIFVEYLLAMILVLIEVLGI